jgi:predicted transcriptional regulator
MRGSVTKGVVDMEAVLEVKLPAELEQKARALAEEEGTTLPEVVQQLIADYVTRKKAQDAEIQNNMAVFERMQHRAMRIGKLVPPGTQAQDVINDIRR